THVMYSAADTAPPDMSTLSLHDALPISTLMVKAGKCSSLCMSRYARPLSPGHRNYRRPGVETSMSSLKPNLPTTSTRTSQFNSDEIDLGYLLAVCLDNKWLIAVSTFLVTLVGVSY